MYRLELGMFSEMLGPILFFLYLLIAAVIWGVLIMEYYKGIFTDLIVNRRAHLLERRKLKASAIEADKRRAHELSKLEYNERAQKLELQLELTRQGMVYNPFGEINSSK